MATIQPKKVHGHTYWQIVESRRINGKPRPVVLKHLGKAENLLRVLEEAQAPMEADVKAFGGVAALWKAAEELGVAQIIDEVAPKRNQGPSVAHYVITAAINRAVRPLPKTRMARWYRQSVLAQIKPLKQEQLSSQRFWDQFNYLDERSLLKIEELLGKRLVQDYDMNLDTLFFDATNFDSFIDSRNSAKLPQRGHAKSKRTDLRLIGLALLVSADHHIPLFWHTYPGNKADSTTFKEVLPRLAKRHRQWIPDAEQTITLVFDKGNNSEENIVQLADTPYHLVGSLVPSQHADLLAIPRRKFKRLNTRFGKTWTHRTSKRVFGKPWTIVITLSENLRRGQLRGIKQHLAKRLKALETLKEKLRNSYRRKARGKGYTRASLEKHVKKLTKGRYLKEILEIKIRERKGKLSLRHSVNTKALSRLKNTILGKRILFTDHQSWTDEQIVEAYRGQHHVERAFRDMKSDDLVRFSPMFHWTDSKIRVHALCCVLALILIGLVHLKITRAGVAISREKLMRELKNIQQIVNLYPSDPDSKRRGPGRPRAQVVLSKTNALQKQLIDLLGLDQYRAR